MPEKKVILSYTKKYYTYTKEGEDIQNLPNLDEVLAAYLRIFEGIAIAAKVEAASPYCFKKLMLFGSLYQQVKNKVLTLAEAAEAGLNADSWKVFLSSCLSSIVAAINNGEYDDPLVEVEPDKEKGGKYVRIKPQPIALCWVEYAGGTLLCRPRKDPNGNAKYGSLTYRPTRYRFFGPGDEDEGTVEPKFFETVAERPYFFSLPVKEGTFILWEQATCAQTGQGFLVSPDQVKVISIPDSVRTTFESDASFTEFERRSIFKGMNYYFPLYMSNASRTITPGFGSDPYNINWVYYLPWLTPEINANNLNSFINGPATTGVVANAYPGAQVEYRRRYTNGNFEQDESYFNPGSGNFQFHMGSPAFIAYALGYKEAALGTFCEATWPQLKPVTIARHGYKRGNADNSLRAPTNTVYRYYQDSDYTVYLTYGSCTGCGIGNCRPSNDYELRSGVNYKSWGLADQSLGDKYYFMFEFIEDVSPYYAIIPEDEDDGSLIGSFNAAQVGFDDHRWFDTEANETYVGAGWLWNDTLTEVSNPNKAPTTILVSQAERPTPFLNHDQVGNLIASYELFPVVYKDFYGNPTSCFEFAGSTYRDEARLRDSGVTIYESFNVNKGSPGLEQCNCGAIATSGYSIKTYGVTRTSTFNPAFCYTGVGLNFTPYLQQLGFSEDDLKFPQPTP